MMPVCPSSASAMVAMQRPVAAMATCRRAMDSASPILVSESNK